MADNVLYYGDNLDVMRRYIKDETVDLVYLDPPFKSDQNYNGLFESPWGKHARIQLLTVGEILKGEGIDYPRPTGANVTLKAAPRAGAVEADPLHLFDQGELVEVDDEPPPQKKKATGRKKRAR